MHKYQCPENKGAALNQFETSISAHNSRPETSDTKNSVLYSRRVRSNSNVAKEGTNISPFGLLNPSFP